MVGQVLLFPMSLFVTSQGDFLLQMGRVPFWAFRQAISAAMLDLLAFTNLEACSVPH